MKLCSYRQDGQARFGYIEREKVFEISGPTGISNLKEALNAGILNGSKEFNFTSTEAGQLEQLELLPPIPNPGKILCVGINFKDHANEANRNLAPYPSLFVRFPDSLVGHRQPIWRPRLSQSFDWEGELAVIIGREASHVLASEALDYVAGFSCFGDHSVRDFQKHTTQATAGKNFRRSGTFGPYLVSREEVKDLSSLLLTTTLDGAVMQQAPLSDLIFDVGQVLAYITQFTDLHPGDVIAMGTPSGVGMSRNPPIWLKPGDRLAIEISGIGRLENLVIDEPVGG
jgi:2-keto-4-pentenoate hydratase/2-oxohepta-3-ene-1,7-dioic acid hydratase in catechol pathway